MTEHADVRRCEEPVEWDALVEASPQRNAFSFSIFLAAMPQKAELWVMDGKSGPVAGAIVFPDGRSSLAAPRPFTLYQGIYLVPPRTDVHSAVRWQTETLSQLIEGLAGHFDSLSFCLHPSLNDVRAFQWFNYHDPKAGQFDIRVAYTGVIDFSAYERFESYLGGIRTSRRQDWAKAQRVGIEATPSDDSAEFDRLHEMTFARQGLVRSRDDEAFVRESLPELLRSDRCEMLLGIEPGGLPVAATVFLYDAACAYYYFGAADPAWRNSGVSTYLMAECLRRAWERGLRRVDVVGMNSPNRGDFKSAFNAVPVPYFTVNWSRPSG